jgi:hypothetical protein
MALLVFFYLYTLTRVVSPGYYVGMKDLYKNLRNTRGEIVFTSPIDYIVGKYYFNDINGDKIKLYVPKNPTDTFQDWPFIYKNSQPANLNTATIISPDESRMTADFMRPLENYTFGNYQVWIKK